MDRVEFTVYVNQCSSIEYILNTLEVPYQRTDGKNSDIVRYVSVTPDELTNSLVEKLNQVLDTRQKDIYIITQNTTVVSDYLRKLNEKVKKPKKIPQFIEELMPLTEPFVKFKKDLLIMIVIASIVALVGFYNNNPAVIIGAMLISPLLGPITAFSFNAAIGRPFKMLHAAFSGFLLILAVVATSAILTSITSKIITLPITHEIITRTASSPIDVIISILLGIAGGIAMVSTLPGILVGVAIAASLVPPAVVTGIGLALLNWNIFSGSFLLTSSNIIGLILGSMIVFLLRGITPRRYHEKAKAKKYLIATILIFVGLGVLLALSSIKWQ
jgi:uncharacterized hydrophobic protein (TIGR00341 family)